MKKALFKFTALFTIIFFTAYNFVSAQTFFGDEFNAAQSEESGGSVGSGESAYSVDSNGKLSLDLKGMDIVEALKMLASRGSLNVVVGSNVRGRVTMFLKDVDVKDAFDLILVSNSLARDERNGIIYVMTERDYEMLYGTNYDDKKEAKIIQLKYAKAAEASKAINQVKTKIGRVIVDEASNTIVVIDSAEAVSQIMELMEKIDKPAESKVFELNYAKTEDLKDKIQEMLTKGLGTMQVDERTNKIVVTDLEENLKRIEKVIEAFDDRLQQVLIEAKILEITLSDAYKLGIDWQAVSNEFQKQLHKDIGIKASFNLASAGSMAPGGEVLIGAFGSNDYHAMVQALKTVGDTNVLSSPRITALNNQEAKILVGSNEPYATNTVTQGTSTTTTATSLTFMDIGIKLYVTPTINKNGYVTIKIKPEVSSKAGTYTYGSPSTTVPIVSTTEAETSVLVKDGNTIIIAGLIKDERSGAVSRVPLLGDLPLLGMAFRKTENTVVKKELVIFLTPHIISGDMDYLRQPLTEPIGGNIFTVPETPTFFRREPVKLAPGYMTEELVGAIDAKRKIERKKIDIRTTSPADYYYTVRNMIIEHIEIPRDDRKLPKNNKVKVSFTLSSGGNLVSHPKIIESANGPFDKIVLKAIENAAPFPVFPISIKESEKQFMLDILYKPEGNIEGKL